MLVLMINEIIRGFKLIVILGGNHSTGGNELSALSEFFSSSCCFYPAGSLLQYDPWSSRFSDRRLRTQVVPRSHG